MSEDDATPSLLTRRTLWWCMAAAAALAGVGAASWRFRVADASDGAEEAFWAMQFESLAGEPLRTASLRGAPLLVNFWATWCPPCVEEMPLLDAFFRQNSAKAWKILGLAVDKPQNVEAFLRKTPVQFEIALAGPSGTALSKSLGNLAGGLPFSVVFGADGRIAHRKMGQVSPADLAIWAQIR